MLFLFHTKLRRPDGVSDQEFHRIWLQEGRASLKAMAEGVIPAIWKVAGKDEVIGVLNVPDADALDRGLHDLPIWKSGNSHLVADISWTPIRDYGAWVGDMEALAAARSD